MSINDARLTAVVTVNEIEFMVYCVLGRRSGYWIWKCNGFPMVALNPSKSEAGAIESLKAGFESVEILPELEMTNVEDLD